MTFFLLTSETMKAGALMTKTLVAANILWRVLGVEYYVCVLRTGKTLQCVAFTNLNDKNQIASRANSQQINGKIKPLNGKTTTIKKNTLYIRK